MDYFEGQNEILNWLKNPILKTPDEVALIPYNTGDYVHLKSLQGVYRIVSIDKRRNVVSLTCKPWSYTDKPVRICPIENLGKHWFKAPNKK